jgi:hypothetical protein
MNWKLIFLLSLFGLAMAFATISLIPMTLEPVFWLVIFITCAWLIAKNTPGRYFLYGFLVSLVNCVWITGAHLYFHHAYLANHTDMAQRMADMPMGGHPLRLMLITGLFIGILSGLILGLFSYIASRLVKKAQA